MVSPQKGAGKSTFSRKLMFEAANDGYKEDAPIEEEQKSRTGISFNVIKKTLRSIERSTSKTLKPGLKRNNTMQMSPAKTDRSLIFQDKSMDEYLDLSDPEDQPRGTFRGLSKSQREQKILALWKRVFLRLQAASVFSSLFVLVHTKLSLFGRHLLGEQYYSRSLAHRNQRSCILFPDSSFKLIWNMLILCLMLYSCTYIPIQVAFIDQDSGKKSLELMDLYFGLLVDMLFLADIIVEFHSASEIRAGTGVWETRPKRLAINYIKSWFFIDLSASLPIEAIMIMLVPGDNEANKQDNARLAKLGRLPRMYRVLRIIRIFKMLKVFKHSKFVVRLIQKMNLNSGLIRVIKFILLAFFFVHVIACLWFLQARLQNFSPETWVYNKNVINFSMSDQYFMSFYWAWQTLTTVGYGDFMCNNTTEYVLTITWMISGVLFYSILVASVTSNIQAENHNRDNLSKTLKSLDDFAKEEKLNDDELIQKIRQFLLNNQKDLFSKVEEDQLLDELPRSLKEEVLYYQHGRLVETIPFLRDCPDNEFVWSLVQKTQKLYFEVDDPIYWYGDFAENFFFIEQGRVKLFAQNGFSFMTYKHGDMIGDSDTLLNELRDCKASATTDCVVHSIKMEDIEDLLADFKEMHESMREEARHKRLRHAKKIAQCIKKFPIYGFSDMDNPAVRGRLEKIGIEMEKSKKTNTAENEPHEINMYIEKASDSKTQHMSKDVVDGIIKFIRRKMDPATLEINREADFNELVSESLKKLSVDSYKKVGLAKVFSAFQKLKACHPYNTNTHNSQGQDKDESGKQENESPLKEHLERLVEMHRMIEDTGKLGVPEATVAIEVLHYFNKDAKLLASKMATVMEVVHYFKQSSEHFANKTAHLEQQAVTVQERQLNAVKNSELLLNAITAK